MSDKRHPEISRDETLAVLKRLFDENWRQYFWQYVAAFGLLILVSASTAFPAWIVYNIVEDVFMRQNLSVAYWIAAGILVAFTVRGFATYGYSYILNKIANNIVARYQRRVFDHLLNLGVGFHNENRSAYIVGQINQNIMGTRNMLNQLVTVFARDLVTLIAMLFVMVYRDPVMSICSLAALPVLYLVMQRYVRKIRQVARKEVKKNSQVTSALVESSQGVEIIKSFTMENVFTHRIKELTASVETQANRIARLNARTKPPTEMLAGLAIASVIAFGGYRVAELGHSPGGMFSFLVAAMLAYDPARKLASFRVAFEKSLVNARMLYELLDMPKRQADLPDAPDLKIVKGKIQLDDVHFAYNGSEAETVINGISLTIEPGNTTALVGPSGGGKSTLIALIQRFYDLNSGSIKVDDQDIAEVTAASLRKNIAYVSQQPILFEGTVIENLRFGAPDVSDEQVIEAAKLAQAHEFIIEQELGYDTPVGEMGSNFSGGQRQRLSIARAIVRDAPILLLDEATSALDNESEKLVQAALEELMKGRTTIVVAHRLSTIQNADQIAVIDGGKVLEEGTHESLLQNKDGLYARLYGMSSVFGELGSESSQSKAKSS